VSTIAGTPGVPGNVNGPAHQARFNRPKSLAFHANTNCLFVSEWVGAPDAACIRCVDLESKTVFAREDSEGLGQCNMSKGAKEDIILTDSTHNDVFIVDGYGKICVAIESDDLTNALPLTKSICCAAQKQDETMYITDSGAHCIFEVKVLGRNLRDAEDIDIPAAKVISKSNISSQPVVTGKLAPPDVKGWQQFGDDFQ
jgi:hypothetical protein